MGEFYEETTRPNLYEDLAPESRFVRVLNNVLEHSGYSPDDNKNVRVALFPKKPNGYYYKVQAFVTYNAWNQPSFTFSVEHYIDELPQNHPLAKYTAVTDGATTSKIGFYDTNGHEKKFASDDDRKDAARQIMGILDEIAPIDSKNIFNEIVEYRFENLVGAFVLSKFAAEGTVEPINEFSAWLAAEEHTERIQDIEDRILAKSVRHDSPAKYETIVEAVTTRRTKTNMNDYKQVDVFAVTDRVAKMLGKKWVNTIKPEQR